MDRRSRREFLAEVGRGMLIASVGAAAARDLGLSRVLADEAPESLASGALEPLVAWLQETPPEKLLETAVAKLRSGTSLDTLLAAAALANARTFGGQDYIGYHTFMALAPAGAMARELPSPLAPLPVLKVLYRNAQRIQQFGGRKSEALHPAAPAALPEGASGAEVLRSATRAADREAAEATFAALLEGPPGEAYNHLQYTVQDEADVHRVVLAWRAWAMLDLTGEKHAHTLLRQSVRYCVDVEERRKERDYPVSPIRELLPRLLGEHRLESRAPGERIADDAWIESFGRTVFGATREQAAGAAAAALAEGISPRSIAEGISLAATRLVLCDPGRESRYSSAAKPEGSVHGDSIGVHASDAANAWRNIGEVSDRRNAVASLIVSAFHTAGQGGRMRDEPLYTESLEGISARDPEALLAAAEAAVRSGDQARASALVHRYGELGHAARPVIDLLLGYGVSEDGALHAEKYYRTVTEEFERTRERFRWRHLVALARVTASEHGRTAPGYEQARELLGV